MNSIDICVVTFNRIEYLKRCIWSIIASTKIRYRIFVIDDMSTDGSKDWLKEMEKRGLIHNVLLNAEKGGTANNFNRVIGISESEWFVMANDDMYFHRGWDTACMDIINEYEDCGIVSFFDYTRWNKDGRVEYLSDKVIRATRTGLGAAIINRELFLQTGGFHLPPGRKMGFFASKFCFRAATTGVFRNKLYATIPYYAKHMDLPNCKLREEMTHYNEFRSKEKNRK